MSALVSHDEVRIWAGGEVEDETRDRDVRELAYARRAKIVAVSFG